MAVASLRESNLRVRSRCPSLPAVVHSYAPPVPVNGTYGVVTSSRAEREGARLTSCTLVGSMRVTSKPTAPSTAAGTTPFLPMLMGFGQLVGWMSTDTRRSPPPPVTVTTTWAVARPPRPSLTV